MDYAKMAELVEHGLPFHELLGIKAVELREGYAKLCVPFRPELIGDPRRPALHGGVISTLVDVCGGFAIWTRCAMDDKIATIDISVDYLRPAPAADLYAEADVRLLGNRVGNAHVVVWSAGAPEVHLAEGRAVYNIRRGK